MEVVTWVLLSCSVWLPGYCSAVAKEFSVCLLAHCYVLLACSVRFLICCYVVTRVLLCAFQVFRVVVCAGLLKVFLVVAKILWYCCLVFRKVFWAVARVLLCSY